MSDWPDLDRMDPELVRRYDQRGPRYTSYPTAPHFSKGFDSEALLGRIRGTSAGAAPPALSIYLHVPYCPQKCLYCGCHSVAIGCPEEPASYAEALKQELELWLGLLGPGRRQAQLAFGGGSPSTLGAEALQGLVAALDRAFPPEPGAERSLELDPGRVDETYLGVLLDLGFTRLSFGIQDFEPEVLKKVGRREDPATVSRHLGYLRSRGFDAVSFDLMLGLPSQSVETLRGTLEKVVSLRPSRLALFPYAHVPWMMPHQEALERYALPSSEERLAMYGLAHRLLPEAGYLPVGMDHFALDGDELVEASRAARLHRNFMGYTTRPGLDQIGLGVSSISDLGASYAQHTKDLGAYRASLEGGRLPFERALLLGRDDEVRRAVIMSLLCNFQADLDEIGRRFDLDWRGAFDDDLERLGPLEADGLLVRPGEGGLLRVTPLGRPFVRIACMAFDRYLEEGGARYSRTL